MRKWRKVGDKWVQFKKQFCSCVSMQRGIAPRGQWAVCKRLGNAWSLNAEIYPESHPRLLKALRA